MVPVCLTESESRGMLLNPGEALFFQEQVEREHDGKSGVLLLTSTRLIFEARHSQGMLGPQSTLVAMEVALSAIHDVQFGRGAVGRPVLQIQSSRGLHRFKTHNAPNWTSMIIRARSALPPPPPPPPPSHGYGGYPGPVVVQVQAAPQGPPPPPSVYFHCRMCGTLNPAGANTRCSSCGAAL